MFFVEKLTGYKATDKDMKCRDHQFELGKWYEAEGDLELCKNGFHFCEQPPGPWCYYSKEETRIFKVEAEEVLRSDEPGTDAKCVSRRIRLIEEIFFFGDGNAGIRNRGNRNTGNRNTGCNNTGSRNAGDCNVGFANVGSNNVGHENTGHHNGGHRNRGDKNGGFENVGDNNLGNKNKGFSNIGDWNEGVRNLGEKNIGSYNLGDSNVGFGNLGLGNATDNSLGCFCVEEPNYICFGVDAEMKKSFFMEKFGVIVDHLVTLLKRDEEISYANFEVLPGCTPEKLKILHEKHMEARK